MIHKIRNEGASRWHEPHSPSEEEDFALVSKVILPNNRKALIMGGIGPQGTEHIGEYVRKNWREEIYSYSQSTGAGPSHSIKGNEFAMSIAIPLETGEPLVQHRVYSRPH